MSKLMFVSFVVLLVFMVIMYGLFPATEPKHNKIVYAISLSGLVQLVVIWRGLLLRRQLSIRALQRIDVYYQVGTGTLFGAAGAVAYDLRSSAYICLIYACLLVML